MASGSIVLERQGALLRGRNLPGLGPQRPATSLHAPMLLVRAFWWMFTRVLQSSAGLAIRTLGPRTRVNNLSGLHCWPHMPNAKPYVTRHSISNQQTDR